MQVNAYLDNKQKKAITTEDRNTVIIAAPGSGKTTVIINRVEYLIKEKKINPQNIVVVTFTRASALDMKKRYIDLSKSYDVSYFGTLHSLFYRILVNEGENINIINKVEAYKLISNVLEDYIYEVSREKVNEIINCISMYKCSEENKDFSFKVVDKEIFYKCYNIYENYKNENKLLDFDDIQIKCRNLLLSNDVILNKYRDIYKYVLVDEFQDCDVLQLEILKLLNGKKNSIFAVGDEDQSIYGFRGARPDFMVNFDKHFIGGKKMFLSVNYRSTANIVGISSKLISNNVIRNEKLIEAYNKFSMDISVMINEDENSQSECIINVISKLIENKKYKYKDCVILYRTNVENIKIINTCIKEDIPFKILQNEFYFFKHSICKDLLAYFKLSLDVFDKSSFTRIINRPYRYISKLSIEKIRKNPIKEDCFILLKDLKDISISKLKQIDSVKKNIIKLKKVPIKQIMKIILEDLGYEKYINSCCEKYNTNKNEYIKIIDMFTEELNKFSDLQEFLKYVDKVNIETSEIKINTTEDRVTLSTIHGVKGMEFKNVFIINCNEENIPYVKNGYCDLEEERRLFYVGITRAIENLWLCVTKNFKCVEAQISRFVVECDIK